MTRPGLRTPGTLIPAALLLLTLLGQCQAQQTFCQLPPGDQVIQLPENTALDAVITTIIVQEGVALTLGDDFGGTFALTGPRVVLKIGLDYETLKDYRLEIGCAKEAETVAAISVLIVVGNINDNPPVFEKMTYELAVNELVAVETEVGRVTATDLDGLGSLYYRIVPPQEYFDLQNINLPAIKVKKRLDYDTIKKVEFTVVVQDTQTSAPPSFSATTTVIINILDIDNRPPWFQPCVETDINLAKVCINSGYQGKVTATQQETGTLPLQPGRLHAMDGDKGLEAAISYRLLSGNVNDIFAINPNTGDITMQKPVDVAGPIVLTVMAYQTTNPDQFATTTVVLEVKKMSLHPPRFDKDAYEGYISLDAGVDSLVLEGKDSSKPLRVQATDQDFADGVNPDVTYEVQDNSDFTITEQGFILMTRSVPAGPLSIQVRAVDAVSGQEDVAAVQVEVAPEGPRVQAGAYRTEDMAALGASLGVLLLICLLFITLMAVHIKNHKTDWKKLKEVSHFHNNLAGVAPGLKSGVQYSNEGFQNTGDSGSTRSSRYSDEPDLMMDKVKPSKARAVEAPVTRSVAPQLGMVLSDASSLAESSTSEGGKEVKPILTKERKDDEGYKAVWFKTDIDPNAKEEVTIIPERAEQDDDDDVDDVNEVDDDADDEDNEDNDDASVGGYYPQTSDL
ncbi:cadherin-related family member 5 isoform X2 [Clupea harengus]|uniref:Cadherin-related family member 5 isoform X2 n=1 Tax=Clupea harengus TaxID=7950 RepID=A0A6P8F6F2_CLUHA|nr:cadherin-related family member 5 isoform X2 [Clupea harengus]